MYNKLKILILLVLSQCMSSMVVAQVATWMVAPVMDNIEFDAANKLYIGHREDSTLIWNTEGKQIVKTTKHVTPFMQRLCLLTDKDNGLYSIVSIDGQSIYQDRNSSKCRYVIDDSFPFFSYGFLLVMDRQDSLYCYINKNGVVRNERFSKAFPFLNRHASVSYFKNPAKRKDEVTKLIDTKFEDVIMQKNGKDIDAGEFDFISSLDENKQAICLSGKQVYSYDYDSDNCTRLTVEDSDGKTSNIQLLSKEYKHNSTDNGGFSISTNKGKMFFSHNGEFLRGEWMESKHKPNKDTALKLATSLDTFSYNNLFGITCHRLEKEKAVVLPAQFEEVRDMYSTNVYNDLAIVRKNGKYGILLVNNKNNIEIHINKDDTLSYTSDTYRGQLTVTFPFKVNKESLENIVSCGDNTCEVDTASLLENVAISGSKFTLDCVLHLPDYKAGNTSEQKHSFFINYNQLTFDSINCKNQFKYRNSWSVSNPTAYLCGDTVMLNFGIIESNPVQRDAEATVCLPDQTMTETMKVDKNLFKTIITALPPGETRLDIKITELKGYSWLFPFILEYQPAAEKEAGTVSLKKEGQQ